MVTTSTHSVTSHGRPLRKLRISLTEVCNYRCFYCMPTDTVFGSEQSLLTPEHTADMVRELIHFGITHIRLTGGEPLLRREFPAFVAHLGRLEGIHRGLTTNGQFLSQHVEILRDHQFSSVNVSLDSLDAATFRRITHGGDLDKVLKGIFAAQNAGLQVKINCVVARSANAQELETFHDFSVQHGLEVRFLELMRIGPARAQHERDFVSADEMLLRLARHSPLHTVDTAPDSTAFVCVSQAGARLGFIASESRPFCGNCSRLRLTARGELRGCLFREEGVALAGQPLDRYPAILEQVALRKPLTRIPELRQPMHEIGG